ncbi:hypothetical protein HRbin16_00698 [bacterium HR16]|nr:hypothetical protein HRbin16_00698 [bacterium HR16]
MGSQLPGGGMPTAPRHTEQKRQETFLRLYRMAFIAFAGGVMLIFVIMLLQDIRNCFTLGCSALLPMRIRSFWAPVEMPVHVHIAFDGGMLLFLAFILYIGYSDLTERIQELQVQREFDTVMQRIRSGEDIDGILADLKKRKGR